MNLFSLLLLTEEIKLKIWQCNVDKIAQLNKFNLTQCQRGASFYLLYTSMIILFKFEVVILKLIHNMASSNINLTLKVIGSMILP